ncbi:hypothetical protein CYMTET_35364 [Cymbomonas tetramitiformis]|uniref:JmjC domain-containing protein n=1 Tax=Cymbomonas tetramitiformis TaxID=36881 RepID=A0AAE0KP09_9CHLO|nr:hypothetical protein CYMTET_35364 [Cymbomonas tetramitiformis]
MAVAKLVVFMAFCESEGRQWPPAMEATVQAADEAETELLGACAYVVFAFGTLARPGTGVSMLREHINITGGTVSVFLHKEKGRKHLRLKAAAHHPRSGLVRLLQHWQQKPCTLLHIRFLEPPSIAVGELFGWHPGRGVVREERAETLIDLNIDGAKSLLMEEPDRPRARVGQHLFAKEALISRLGTLMVQSNQVPYAKGFGAHLGPIMTLQDYVKHWENDTHEERGEHLATPPGYVFQSLDPDRNPVMNRTMQPPLMPAKYQVHAYQWSIGPRGAGAHYHMHDAAWSALIYGQKLWTLLPPSQGLVSNVPSIRMHQQASPGAGHGAAATRSQRVGPLRCSQRAGDLIYVPDLWAHSVLNIRASVGMAYELELPKQFRVQPSLLLSEENCKCMERHPGVLCP